MGNQSLDQTEILCIRWAHDDPNPVAQDSINRADRDALYALMKAKGISMDNAGFEYPAEYNLPSSKRAKLADGTDVTSQFPELAYPDTSTQFGTTAENGAGPQLSQEEYTKYCEDYYSYYLASQQNSQITPISQSEASRSSVGVGNKTASDTNNKWVKCVDDASGATYFFNETTQESSWGLPDGQST